MNLVCKRILERIELFFKRFFTKKPQNHKRMYFECGSAVAEIVYLLVSELLDHGCRDTCIGEPTIMEKVLHGHITRKI